MEISSLDCNMDPENVVRFIDAFDCKLELVKLKFEKGSCCRGILVYNWHKSYMVIVMKSLRPPKFSKVVFFTS